MNAFAATYLAPPFPLVLLAIALLVWKARSGASGLLVRRVAALVAMALAISCFPVTSKLLFVAVSDPPLEVSAVPRSHAIIIAPTGGLFVDNAGNWHASSSTIRRMGEAVRLSRSTALPVFVSGGEAIPGAPPEAEVAIRGMAPELVGRLIVDTEAKNSFDTAVIAARELLPRGFRTAVLATDIHHLPRMRAALEGQGFEVIAAPSTPQGWYRIEWRDFIPSNSGLIMIRSATMIYAGLVYYWARGWL